MQEVELLLELKKDMCRAFPQVRIEIVEKPYNRLYFSLYYKGDKHKWGQVKVTPNGIGEKPSYEPLICENYLVQKITCETHVEVIDFFSKHIEKKSGWNQISFDLF